MGTDKLVVKVGVAIGANVAKVVAKSVAPNVIAGVDIFVVKVGLSIFAFNDTELLVANVPKVVAKSAVPNVIAGVVIFVVNVGLSMFALSATDVFVANVAKVVAKSVVPRVIAGVVIFVVNVGDAIGALRSNALCVAVDIGFVASLVLSTLLKPTIDLVIPVTVPENVGDAKGAFKSKALCVAVDIGFNKSLVLSTLLKPTIDFVIPVTVPENVGDAKGAFRSNALCVAVDIGFDASLVLSTLLNPTLPLVNPDIDVAPVKFITPVKAGDAKGAFRSKALCVAVDIGFDASLVLSTLANPTLLLVIPDIDVAPVKFIAPVNDGEAKGAFKSNALCVDVDIGFDASLVLSTLLNPTLPLVIPDIDVAPVKFIAPVKAGDAKGAFRSKALCVAVDIGLDASLVLSTLANPTLLLVIPDIDVAPVKFIAPVKAGDAKGAFRSKAFCVVVDIGFDKSLVLSTLLKPTIDLVIPVTVPENVGDTKGAFRAKAVSVSLFKYLFAATVESARDKLVMSVLFAFNAKISESSSP